MQEGSPTSANSDENTTEVEDTHTALPEVLDKLPKMKSMTRQVSFNSGNLSHLNLDEKEREELEEGRIGILLSAAARNAVAKMSSLIQDGVKAGSADYDGRTGMHLAAANGHLEAIKLLLNSGAGHSPVDRFGTTPMDEAVQNFRDDVVQYLKGVGSAHGESKRFETQLLNASRKGGDEALEEVKNLLKNGTISVQCADYDGRSPLHFAVTEGNFEMVSLLVDHGADPNAKDRWDFTPTQEAQRRHLRTGHDPILTLLTGSDGGKENAGLSKTVVVFATCQVALILLLALFTEYSHDSAIGPQAEDQTFGSLYGMYQDVHVMIFIGFGFLMTFLRRNGYSSLGWTFLIATFCIQWYILCGGFFEKLLDGGHHLETKIEVSVSSLIKGDFAAGTVLITYGVLLGRVSPLQLLAVAGLEVAFFSLNESIGLHMEVTDLGGSMVIHMFGAFFGLAVSLVLGRRAPSPENSAVYHSDMFAMIGTVFLWMYWPSFNAVFGTGNTQHRAVINTVFSLCGSCFTSFFASYYLRRENRFNMVDIQNATLAGGVAMGTCADLDVGVGFSVLLGAGAGVISVLGYTRIQEFLQVKLGLDDTCGVNNLHGMPSLLAALVGIAVTGAAEVGEYGEQLGEIMVARPGRDAGEQALHQFYFMLTTLGISIASGLVTGKLVGSAWFEPVAEAQEFKDDQYWEVPTLERPYYFDERGEINRENAASGDPQQMGGGEAMETLQRKLEALELRLKEVRSVTMSSHKSGGGVSRQGSGIGMFSRQRQSSIGNLLGIGGASPASPASKKNLGGGGGQQAGGEGDVVERMEALFNRMLAASAAVQQQPDGTRL